MNNLLELLEANQELNQLIEQELDNLTVKEFIQLHEQGILHEGKLSSIIGLGSKAKNAVKQFGINVLGDKENQKALKAAINRVKDDLEFPLFRKGVSKKVQKLDKQINKLGMKMQGVPFKDAQPDIKASQKLNTKVKYIENKSNDRFTKNTEAEYTKLRKMHDIELAKLKKSQKSVDDARITAGIIAGSSVAAPIGLKIESDLYNARKESKKSRVEKLKDKIKDIMTKD